MKLIIATLLSAPLLLSCNPTSTGTKAKVNDGSGTSKDDPVVPGTDPLAIEAWHLLNTGQKTYSLSAGTPGEDMNINEVHEDGIFGAGIRIAISDSGVDVNNPDLKVNQLSSLHRDYSSSNSANWRGGNPYPIEEEAHGTAVAGLAAAAGWNGIGSRGVAPSANYAGFLFIGDFHTYDSSYLAKVIDQITGDFDIFNYSYGYAGCQFVATSQSIIDAYKSGVTNLRNGKGAIYVKAAGNDYAGYNNECTSGDGSLYFGNTNTGEDQNLPYLILVGALGATGKISSYSTPGSGLWISAAGGETGTSKPAMLTTDISGCQKGYASQYSYAGFNKGSSVNPNCNYTSLMNGTSSAAPVLSGVVALMLEANESLTWRDIKHILAVTADRIDFSTAQMSHPDHKDLAGHTYDYLYVKNAANYYFSNTYGFGRVNAQAAVNMAKTYVSSLGPYVETPWEEDIFSPMAIPNQNAAGLERTLTLASTPSFIESVQIMITTDHSHLGDLGIELTSPLGTVSKLLLVNSNINDTGLSDYILLTNAFYGEDSNGAWKLEVIDGGTRGTGNLSSWSIRINGH